MRKNKPKKFKRFLLKSIWFSFISVVAIIAWFGLYAISWEVNQPNEGELVPTLSATIILLILFIIAIVAFRKSSKTILRWTGKSFNVLSFSMLVCVLIMVSLTGNTSNPTNKQSQIEKAITFNNANTLNLFNLEREQAGAVPLSSDSTLDQAATNLAKDMLANNYRSFDGRDPWAFINNTGYPYNYASFFYNEVKTSETDFVKSILASQNLKSYINGKQFLFVGIGTAQKDKSSPILAVVYLVEPPQASTGQARAGYRHTSSPIILPDADYGQMRPLDLPEINPEDYRSPNSTPYEYKPPETNYPKPDDCHVYEYFC